MNEFYWGSRLWWVHKAGGTVNVRVKFCHFEILDAAIASRAGNEVGGSFGREYNMADCAWLGEIFIAMVIITTLICKQYGHQCR